MRSARLMSLVRQAVLVAGLLLVECGPLFAQTPPARPAEGEQVPPVWQTARGRVITLFPAGDVYPVYVADPHRPTSAIVISFLPRQRIPDTSSPRWFLAGGGHFGMLRVESPGGRAWQVSIDAGFDAVFDSQHKNDGIGWDGNYGLSLTTAATDSRLGLRAALFHHSAHLGDEYAERTGTRRINYTREEVAVGLAWKVRPRWRTYGEVGFGYVLRSDTQKPWRLQAGVEYERRPTVFGGRMAWYGALDVSALEERDWRLDPAVQGGLLTRSGGRAYRIFAEWYDGRPRIGNFSSYSEASFSLGFKIDL
jgi:hypothetical protein